MDHDRGRGGQRLPPLVLQVLDNGKGFNVDGRAGTGKSFVVKELHAEMKRRGLKHVAAAPANKAARIIRGFTIHKLIASFNLERFKDKGLLLRLR